MMQLTFFINGELIKNVYLELKEIVITITFYNKKKTDIFIIWFTHYILYPLLKKSEWLATIYVVWNKKVINYIILYKLIDTNVYLLVLIVYLF